jgi:hypothetical protein
MGNAEKIWTFGTDGTLPDAGLAYLYQHGTPASTASCTLASTNSQDAYIWAPDPGGRPYIYSHI